VCGHHRRRLAQSVKVSHATHLVRHITSFSKNMALSKSCLLVNAHSNSLCLFAVGAIKWSFLIKGFQIAAANAVATAPIFK
jgi:hypothetical protein